MRGGRRDVLGPAVLARLAEGERGPETAVSVQRSLDWACPAHVAEGAHGDVLELADAGAAGEVREEVLRHAAAGA
eukprot:8451507-Alexandrium_andersonii.AAC.1